MRADERYIERLPPSIGNHLAEAMAENQKWLTSAEERVAGDIERACDLVEKVDCEAPTASPRDQRIGAFLILLEYQKEEFGEARATQDSRSEGYTLANVTETSLILMRRQSDDTTTLLEATASPDRQISVTRIDYNMFANLDPTNRRVTEEDKLVMADTARRLRRVNRKWHQLLKEHPLPKPGPPRVPSPRPASEYS